MSWKWTTKVALVVAAVMAALTLVYYSEEGLVPGGGFVIGFLFWWLVIKLVLDAGVWTWEKFR